MPYLNFRRWDTRTPLERYVKVPEMRVTPTGLLVPWRSDQSKREDSLHETHERLVALGCKIVKNGTTWDIIPPYPPNASPSEMAAIDNEWRRWIANPKRAAPPRLPVGSIEEAPDGP